MSTATRPVTGVQFPEVDGRRSTSAVAQQALADSVRGVDPVLADAVLAEEQWRSAYPSYVRTITELSATRPGAGLEIATQGLASLHAAFVVEGPDGPQPLDDALGQPAGHLATERVDGSGGLDKELAVPYRGQVLRGDALRRQVLDWVAAGTVEPSLADAVDRLLAHPEWLDLRGEQFALLGAAGEVAPTEQLLRWGATVAAVDLPSTQERLRELVATSAGTLLLPGDGADLLDQAPEVATWLSGLEGPVTVGNFVYLDGEGFVRVAMAVDAVLAELLRRRDDVAIAYVATPTDVFAVPQAAVEFARAGASGLAGATTALGHRLTLKRAFVPHYAKELTGHDGEQLGIADVLIVRQGPNYTLAKRLQRWRATVAREAGVVSSAHVAPPTRTRSVLKNKVLAAAYDGAHVFGVEVFEPATTRTLMAALLVHDLRWDGAAARPETKLASPEHQFMDAAVHGGLWRAPWEPLTALPAAAVIGARAFLRR